MGRNGEINRVKGGGIEIGKEGGMDEGWIKNGREGGKEGVKEGGRKGIGKKATTSEKGIDYKCRYKTTMMCT